MILNIITMIKILLFDLDGTLYDQACGYEEEIHNNIFRYMAQNFDTIEDVEHAKKVWKPIFDKYNLTKRGLIGEGYSFDGTDYDRFIRQGAKNFISPDPELRVFLKSFPTSMRKVIFTNAPEGEFTAETCCHIVLENQIPSLYSASCNAFIFLNLPILVFR